MSEPTPPQESAPSAPENRRGFLGRLDPGWATVIAAAIAIVGTVLTMLFQSADRTGPQQPPPTVSHSASQTSASQSPSQTVNSSPSASTVASDLPGQPTFSVISTLAPHIRDQVVSAGESLRSLSLALPLLVRDEFDNNDYGWALGATDYADGISCTTTMTSGSLQIKVVSGRGPAYCYNGVPRNVTQFTLVADLGIPAQRDSEVGVMFGAVGEEVLVAIRPLSQTIAVSSGSSTLLASTFVEDSNPSAPNRVQLVVIEDSLVVFIGDKLVLLGSDMPDAGAGPPRLYVRLNEANQQLTLQSDRMELRGQ